MIYITAVHMSGGEDHQHIAEVRWQNPSTTNTGQTSTAGMVNWIDNQNGDARVTDGQNEVRVGVVDATPKYIRTYADGEWTNNLLSLPRY